MFAPMAHAQMPPPLGVPPGQMQNPDPISGNGVHVGPPLMEGMPQMEGQWQNTRSTTITTPPIMTSPNTSNLSPPLNGNAGASKAGNGSGNGNIGLSNVGNGNQVSGAGGVSGSPASSE